MKTSRNSKEIETILYSVNGILWEADACTFEFTFISPQVERILGYTANEWYSKKNFWQDHIHPEDREKTIKFCHDKTLNNEDHEFEYRLIASDGRVVWIKDIVSVTSANGSPKMLSGLMVDITDQKETQMRFLQARKRAYHLAKIGHWEINLQNDSIYWSDEVRLIHEVGMDYVPTLKNGINFYEEGNHREQIRKKVEEAIHEGGRIDGEFKIITAKKNKRWVRVVGECERIDGKTVRIFGTTQNITKRKEAEYELNETNRKLQQIIEHSTNLFYTHDTEHNLTYISPQSVDFFGYQPKKAMRRWTEFLTDHPKNKKGIELTQKALKTGKAQPGYELQLKRADGKVIWVQVNEKPIFENGKVKGMSGSLTDITTIKDSKEQLDNFINNINGMLHRYQKSPDGSDRILFVSEGVRDLHELSPEEVLASPEGLWKQILEDDLQDVKESVKKSAEELSFWDHKWRIETPSGKRKWLHGRGGPWKADDGSITWDTIIIDITEQELAKIELEEHHRIVENNQAEVYILGKEELDILYANSVACDNFGYSLDEITRKKTSDLNADIPLEDQRKMLSELENGNVDSITFETKHRRADGSIYDAKVVLSKDTFKGEEVYVASALDITEQKTLRKDLQQQIKFSNEVLNSLPGLFFMLDEQLKIERVNNNVLDFIGIDRNDISGVALLKFIASDERIRIKKKIREVLSSGYAEMETVMKTGDQKHHFFMNGCLFKQDGTKYIIINGIDITDLVKARKNNVVLLQEVHHRVKNNLAIISGLLQMELLYVNDEKTELPLQRSMNRITSMAKVHELLYQNTNLSSLNIREYIKDMVDAVRFTLDSYLNVSVLYDVQDIEMNVNEAIPLGMLINELVTNSFKYAFDGEGGQIEIMIKKENNYYYVCYRDNGPGLPEGVNVEEADSLGLTIIFALLNQLKSTYKLDSDNQFFLEFSFKPKIRGAHSNL